MTLDGPFPVIQAVKCSGCSIVIWPGERYYVTDRYQRPFCERCIRPNSSAARKLAANVRYGPLVK